MNPAAFINKWRKVELTERSAAQQHFLDLCALVEHQPPAELDPVGDSFTFERGAAKHGGGDGWADVWKRGYFAIEYKGKHKDLDAAYSQLLKYREDLENPPLLVTCDMDRIIIRTNFTATPTRKIEIELDALGKPENIEALRAMFHEPQKLKPGVTSTAITTKAASHIADLAQTLRGRDLDPHQVALFLDRIVFCLFAEDIDLLPKGLFSDIVAKTRAEPERFAKLIAQLFDAMAHGGDFGAAVIRHFNGNLFTDTSVLGLARDDLDHIHEVASLDWSAIDPSIFGTLFVRGMDPAKRSQLGAEYTSRTDIETIVEPVVFQPLRREWAALQATIGSLLSTGEKKTAAARSGHTAKPLSPAKLKKATAEADAILHQFLLKLAGVKVLDPACGSGNFLYVTLQKLKDLEKEVILFAMDNDLGGYLPQVGPWQLHGIEIDPYAFDLAQMTVWIGYLQWTKANGFGITQEPILRPMEGNFKCMDAILDLSDPANPREPEWPDVDCIVGNPPFLGGKLLRSQLGDEYVNKLFTQWSDRVPREADLCCYWFEKARQHITAGRCPRTGLLATQGIRGGANREVLKRIKETGDIFFAESDRPWILDGANVHVSMVGFDNGDEQSRTLDGKPVTTINANLTATADTTQAKILTENKGIAFMGDTKVGPFEVPEDLARSWLSLRNPHGRSNAEVVRPWANGLEITRVPQRLWIVDFPPGMSEAESAQFEAPFEHIKQHVKPMRASNKRAIYAQRWWIHGEARPEVRATCLTLPRYLVTMCVSKHRLFVWLQPSVLPDHALIVFARADDYFFGVLHSRVHEVWSLAQGTQLREKESGFRYTPTTCFETFPLPQPGKLQQEQIAEAARVLDESRVNWLGDRTDKARTLTTLYNKKPAWLADLHQNLDAAVFAAYGWPCDLSDDQILERLLALNKECA